MRPSLSILDKMFRPKMETCIKEIQSVMNEIDSKHDETLSVLIDSTQLQIDNYERIENFHGLMVSDIQELLDEFNGLLSKWTTIRDGLNTV